MWVFLHTLGSTLNIPFCLRRSLHLGGFVIYFLDNSPFSLFSLIITIAGRFLDFYSRFLPVSYFAF